MFTFIILFCLFVCCHRCTYEPWISFEDTWAFAGRVCKWSFWSPTDFLWSNLLHKHFYPLDCMPPVLLRCLLVIFKGHSLLFIIHLTINLNVFISYFIFGDRSLSHFVDYNDTWITGTIICTEYQFWVSARFKRNVNINQLRSQSGKVHCLDVLYVTDNNDRMQMLLLKNIPIYYDSK